jgi:hypothetical protein
MIFKILKKHVFFAIGKVVRIQKTFTFVYKTGAFIASIAVASNSTLPPKLRLTAAGRAGCCSAAIGAHVSRGLKNPVLERNFVICCGLMTTAYGALGGPAESITAINFLATKTAISFRN